MEAINKKQILSKTNYGLLIYSHILQKYYPNQTVLSLSGRTCSPTKNPFNADKPTLNISIFKENVLGNAMDREFARHEDNENAIPAGDAFDFAELHYKQSGAELLQIINKEMNLHVGEKFSFYGSNQKNVSITEPVQPKSPKNTPNSDFLSPDGESTRRGIEVGEVGWALFSFFKAPVRNTIPHKSICLLDAYNYIVGEYAKQRTEKLRTITDPKQARQYKATNFDYCTFSGMFTTRNDKALVNRSDLLCVDFDHLQNVDLLRNQLLQDEYFETQLLFVSPSGDGLKWIISIDAAKTSHGEFFVAVANYILQTYKVAVDKSGRDISRACFLAYDPNAFIHPNNL